MDFQLSDKVAFVTGASKGIGRAVAEQLAGEGDDVVITARTAGPLERAATEIAGRTGGKVLALAGAISKPEGGDRCGYEARRQFGHIDILVTCAGSSPGGL